MTCDDFRERWLAREPSEIARGGVGGHAESCEPCRIWERRQRALDDGLGAAIVTAPPPELVARLTEIPRMALAARAMAAPVAPSPEPWAWGAWLETTLLTLVGLALLTLTGFDFTTTADVVLARFGDVLQALPLIFNTALLSYLASVAFTIVEALATLILVALALLQVSPDLFNPNRRPAAENG